MCRHPNSRKKFGIIACILEKRGQLVNEWNDLVDARSRASRDFFRNEEEELKVKNQKMKTLETKYKVHQGLSIVALEATIHPRLV